ncbi:uncharacterized protein LOC131225178 [Magnolia sinica]|uniref:uncharacterized protein LOC131225178 n=1 Tax=Magnolia sinica TaxID=86752 RepID=UPI002658E503|nr:uncharacterized protein LOC131225178 [Magnolia sinica]
MGQSAGKLTKGDAEKKDNTIPSIIKKYCKEIDDKISQLKLEKKGDGSEQKLEDYELSIFYQEVCRAVQEMNREHGGGTQLRVPDTATLKDAFKNYKEKPGDLPNIIKTIILNMGFEGKGFMNVLYIFAAPITGALVKKGFFPDLVSDNVFIPVITSASVLVLASLNKI